MKNIKPFAIILSSAFYFLVAIILQFPLYRSISGIGAEVNWADFVALIFCGIIPAITLFMHILDLEYDSLGRQILFSILYLVLAALAAAGIFLVIVIIYGITQASFFEIAASLFLLALIGAPAGGINAIFFEV